MIVRNDLIPFLLQISQKTPKYNQINTFKATLNVLVQIPLNT